MTSGRVTVTVGGYPLVSIRSDEKELDVEVSGLKEAGLSLSKVVKLQELDKGPLLGPLSVPSRLSGMGWRLTLYEKGERLVTLGRGTSRLTGHIGMNPLKLKKLVEALG